MRNWYECISINMLAVVFKATTFVVSFNFHLS